MSLPVNIVTLVSGQKLRANNVIVNRQRLLQ